MWMELTTPCSLRNLTLLAAGCGLLIASGISKAGAVEANCPQWTTPKCTAWNMGPPPSCAGYECVADKQSDPPKATSIGPVNPGGAGGVHFPIVRPPVVTVGGINPGTGTTTTIYAKRNFKPMIVHHSVVKAKTFYSRSPVREIVSHQPTVSRGSEHMMVMHSFGGGGGHGHH